MEDGGCVVRNETGVVFEAVGETVIVRIGQRPGERIVCAEGFAALRARECQASSCGDSLGRAQQRTQGDDLVETAGTGRDVSGAEKRAGPGELGDGGP